MTFESQNDGIEAAMGKLLKSLEQSCILTIEMIRQGFQRIYEDMPDISIDIPLSYNILERFVKRCYGVGLLSDNMLKDLPSR
jgi:programmed cell death protein 4